MSRLRGVHHSCLKDSSSKQGLNANTHGRSSKRQTREQDSPGSSRTYSSSSQQRIVRDKTPVRKSRSREHRGPGGELSDYYRHRFGSHSPEEYQNLRLCNIDPKASNSDLRDILEKVYGRYGDVQVKVVQQLAGHGDRHAYVNFYERGVARAARRESYPKLVDLLGRYLKVDPAGVIRDQSGRFIHLNSRRQSPPPPPSPRRYDLPKNRIKYRSRRELSPVRFRHDRNKEVILDQSPPLRKRNGRFSSPQGPRFSGVANSLSGYSRQESPAENGRRPKDGLDAWKVDEALHGQTYPARTLFVGNLCEDVKAEQMRQAFQRYGVVEDVDIKLPLRGSASGVYAFVQFQNVDMAQEAKYFEQNQVIVGGMRSKIGYGKPLKSRRLYVGGLGPWTNIQGLVKEFERFGTIEKVDYVKDENHACIQYVSIDSALEAFERMRNFSLGADQERIIRLDFIALIKESDEKCESRDPRKRKRVGSPLRSGPGKVRRGPHTPPESPPISPPSSGGKASDPPLPLLRAANLGEVEQVASPIWTGALVLKRSSYAVRLYKLRGDDDLVDSRLRDPLTQESLRLHLTQRRPYVKIAQSEFLQYLDLSNEQVAFLLVSPNPNAQDLQLADSPARPLKALVHYLAGKAAAGVVMLNVGTELSGCGSLLYLFPRSELSDLLLQRLAPQLEVFKNCADDCLLSILVKDPPPFIKD